MERCSGFGNGKVAQKNFTAATLSMGLILCGRRNTGAYGLRTVAEEHLRIFGQRIHGQAMAHMFPTHPHRDVFMPCPLNIMYTTKFVSIAFPISKCMPCS